MRALAAAVTLLALASCTSSTPVVEEEVLVLEVAAETAPCTGEMTTTCLRVRAPDEEEWRLFYDPIEGFEHREGTRYVLEVARRPVDYPPADGSAWRYRLLQVLERRDAP